MDELLKSASLAEVCAIQWKRSVDDAEKSLSALGSDRVFRLSYESLVYNPHETLTRMLRFLKMDASPMLQKKLGQQIISDSVGVWKHRFASDEISRLEQIMEPTLARHGYEFAQGRISRAA
jgi:hypothetical protein